MTPAGDAPHGWPREFPDVPAFTLRQLAYFAAAAEAGTVAAAADHLHVSASAISDAISELERILGAHLCVRRRAHGLTPTPAGVRVLERARPLLAQARELSTTLDSVAGELVGPIAVGCYPTLAPTILPRLLGDFGGAHPRVDLQVVEATADRVHDLLDTGGIDLAFTYETLIRGTPARRRLFSLRAHVVLAVDDPLAADPTVRLEDLASRDLILLDAAPSTEHTLSLFAARGLTPQIRHRTSSFEAVRALVGRGLGYGILVQRPANSHTYEGYRVVVKEIAPAVPPVGVDMIWSAGMPTPARLQALIDFAAGLDWAPRTGIPQPGNFVYDF